MNTVQILKCIFLTLMVSIILVPDLARYDGVNSPNVLFSTSQGGNPIWNHDCSNSSGFAYNDDWNINWTPWEIVSGTLSSDGSALSVSNIQTGSDYHGPVFEYALPVAFKVEDLLDFSVLLTADNSLTSYVGYQAVILGDANRNPVVFMAFSDGWTGSSQGAYGVNYVYADGSRSSYGSGYPITWTSFNGLMSLSYDETNGLTGHVEGVGTALVTTLSEADRTREIHYLAIASARVDSLQLFSMFVEAVTIEFESATSTATATTTTGSNTNLPVTTTILSDNMMLVAAGSGVVLIGLVVVAILFLVKRKSDSSQETEKRFDGYQPPPPWNQEQPIQTSQAKLQQKPTIESPSLRAPYVVPSPDNEIRNVILTAAATPRVVDSQLSSATQKGPIQISSGFDVAGENLKLAVKVANNDDFTILNVQVILDVPNGFEFVKGTQKTQDLGSIPGGGFQSAIFWLRPCRCVDGEYGGTIIYKDAKNQRKTLEIPPKRIVNICPMLSSTESADEVFTRLKMGSLTRNCASFEFSGGARSVLQMAEARLKGLVPADHSETDYEDGTYLGYSCYVGETKYGEYKFAAEIQVSGTLTGGVLTLAIYSDDERILSGFFTDVMYDIRKHVEVIEEKVCPVATCSKCGGNLDISEIPKERIYRCSYCGAIGKLPPWL